MKKIITCLMAVMLFAPAVFSQNQKVNVYPSPTKSGEKVTVVFNDGFKKEYTTTLISPVGKPLLLANLVVANSILLTLPELSTGIYILRFTSPGSEPIIARVAVFK